MAEYTRVCTECGETFKASRPDAKTDKPSCRSARSRRLKRAHKQAAAKRSHSEHTHEVAAAFRPDLYGREVKEVAHEVIAEELRPVVREAITEDALRAIQRMIGLTPRVVELLAQDIESDDATVRQRAYTLISKYTLGNQAIVSKEEQGGGQLVVNFALPRPDSQPPLEAQGEVVDGTVDEDTQQCDTCNDDKPLSQFVAGSQRCRDCFDAFQAQVQERFGTGEE